MRLSLPCIMNPCRAGTVGASEPTRQQQQQDRAEAIKLPPTLRAGQQYMQDTGAMEGGAALPSMDEAYTQFISELGSSRSACSQVMVFYLH